MMAKAAIFDMDGTILDTSMDLTLALNHAMAETGHAHDFTSQQVSLFFGSGVEAAIRRALAMEGGASLSAVEHIGEGDDGAAYGVTSAEVERVRRAYLPYYQAHCNDHTGPYPGIIELLASLRTAGVACAVVSNKPDAAVQALCRELFVGCFDASLGEQSGLSRKPAPDMVDEALRRMGVSRREAVYIGDTEIDQLTAENAAMPCLLVSWGFRSREALSRLGSPILEDAESLGKAILGA